MGTTKPVLLALPGETALALGETSPGSLWQKPITFLTQGELSGKVPSRSLPSFHRVLLDEL